MERRAQFKSNKSFDKFSEEKLAVIKYCDDESSPTQNYPLNPNGSKDAIAGYYFKRWKDNCNDASS